MDLLKTWYQKQKDNSKEKKKKRLRAMMNKFNKNVLPKMKSSKYKNFSKFPLNNAALLGLKTYQYDLSDFNKVYIYFGSDFSKFLKFCKNLEDKDDPEASLKDFIKTQLIHL